MKKFSKRIACQSVTAWQVLPESPEPLVYIFLKRLVEIRGVLCRSIFIVNKNNID